MPGRFYFYDLETKSELADHPLNGATFEGTGAYVEFDDKRLAARTEIFITGRKGVEGTVGKRNRVTTDDFGCEAVGVKLWFPNDAQVSTEKFFLVPNPCEGHESTDGPIGNVVYCDGTCVPRTN